MTKLIHYFPIVAFLVTLFGSAASGSAAGAHVVLNRQHDIQGLTWTVFSDESGEPTARFRIARIFVENERRGFLRIGLLPMVVIENVRVQLLSDEIEPFALVSFQEELGRIASEKPIRIRGFSFENKVHDTVLQAATIDFETDAWRLPHGSILRVAGEKRILPGGALQLDGEGAGILQWRDQLGDHHFQLLGHSKGEASPRLPTQSLTDLFPQNQ